MKHSGSTVANHRIGVDIGGTFTDLLLIDDCNGKTVVGKVLTTPDDPSRGVEQVLVQTLEHCRLDASQVRHLVHGTTLVTNTIIERKGARTALLATKGFRDSVEIGREHRYELYDLFLDLPRPLTPRHLRFDIAERTLADGTLLLEVDEEMVEALAAELAERRVEAVAISFLHSFTNPANEQAARRAVTRAAPGLRVSTSSEVAPEIREYERTSTTIANVYVQPLAEQYLQDLQSRLADLGFGGSFFVMLSSGGIATVETAARFPIRLLESGPAAGALAAATLGAEVGVDDLLSFDMGGTTAKLCVIAEGRPEITYDFEVDRRYRFRKGSGLPVKTPVIEMIEIGAGGGSIARINQLGLLKIGPESAGSDPGPVCYGLGGSQPTVTDADLTLGYLDPDYFLGGRMTLDAEAARQAIESQIAKPLGLSVTEAAWGIHQLVNENMANAARVHVVERGKNPQTLPVIAFGGAGPVHGYRVAELTGCSSLILPPSAGVTSALGFLVAPLAFDFVRSYYARLDDLDWDHLNQMFADLERQGTELLIQSGAAPHEITHTRSVDIRYIGQGHEVRVPVAGGILGAGDQQELHQEFDRVYRSLYGRSGPDVGLEALTWRVISAGPIPAVTRQSGGGSDHTEAALKGSRPAYFPECEGFRDTPVYNRYFLREGDRIKAPAIVEERESTAVIGPGGAITVDSRLNLVVSVAGKDQGK
ncbi:MAG: hydantoinase/oxoprolinase family protein [bacterium]|nr:hydantoinase/oxoprolinase family protein [bacterium]